MNNSRKYIYIDESCHLKDRFPVMGIGYIKIDEAQHKELSQRIKSVKLKHHNPTEIKWTKVSKSRINLYKELIDLFCETDMDFRCVLIKNKLNIDHNTYNENDPDIFYYKAAYYLLRSETNPQIGFEYRVWLDIKDSRGKNRLLKIDEILKNTYKQDGNSSFIFFQDIHSHESQFLQLADLFIGAVVYKSREDIAKNNVAKNFIVDYLEEKIGYVLNSGTPPNETKFNIFNFQLRKPVK